MYDDFRKKGEIIDFKVDKTDTITIKSFSGYKIEYIERFKDDDLIVKMYLTEKIKYPIQLFVNYPKEDVFCPLHIEYFYRSAPKNTTIVKLLSVEKFDNDDKINEILNLLPK